MTALQQSIYDLKIMQYGAHKTLSPGIQSLIFTLSCVEAEELQLQKYCDENGTCYQVTGKSGDVYSRMRPEWQQLKEARMRKQAIIARLESWAGEGVEENDELQEFLQ
jgi:hypothetical protein|tara:strand:+ start:109 stop:432 length:324 start_codon:yes stop_codon:yes gene_type:complete